MTGGKDTEMSPMFPRLHLHDTEKGGPKAPPRNKMALYEQLSVPSQRFNSGSPAFLSLPSSDGGSLVSSTYPSHGGIHERAILGSFNNSPAESRLPGKLPPYSSAEISSYASMTSFQSSNVMKTLALADKWHSFQLDNISGYKNSSLEKVNEVADYRLPLFSRSRMNYFKYSRQNDGKDKSSYPRTSCSLQLRPACEKQMKGTDIADLNSMQHVKSHSQKVREFSQAHHLYLERSVSVSLTRDNILEDASSIPSAKEQSLMPSKRKYLSLDQESEGCSREKISRLHGANALVDKESLPYKMVNEAKTDIDTRNKINVRSELFSRPPLEGDNKNSNGLDNPSKFCAPKECDHMQIGDLHGCNTMSKYCVSGPAVASDICSDDAVEVLGEQHFWKARSTIAKQQRIFAKQLFELHKLIAVQRKIAKSPHLLVEVNISVKKDNPKKLLQKENFSNQNANEKCFQKFPPPPVGKDIEQTNARNSNQGMCPTTVLEQPPVPPLAKSSSWSFPPPGSQWLIPVISPTEGLVYKPYTGPYPPPTSFLAPAYGSHGSMNPTGKSEDYPTAAFGIAGSHQGIGILKGTSPYGQSYFPPYGLPLPVMNSSISSSKPEQMHPFPTAQSKVCGNQFQTEDIINLNVPHSNAHKVLNHMSRTNSPGDVRFQASKESELQGSSESSPVDREKAGGLTLFPMAPIREMANGLPLFPMVPTLQASNENAQTREGELQTEVIKVVPHNPKSACESAARIYQSIQEERKQL